MLDGKVEELKEELINTTIESIRIRSVAVKTEGNMPYGEGVCKALNHILNKASEMGFKTKNIDNYVGYAEIGEGEDYVIALGHLDVVPEGDGWKYPPYAGEIHDGKIYGRGALDDKGPIISALYGAKAIMDSGLPIKNRIRIVFGTAEEIGGDDIEHYLKYEKAPIYGFTPDAEFPIINGEKGILNFDLEADFKVSSTDKTRLICAKGGQVVNMVPDLATAEIEAKDIDSVIKKLENIKVEMEDLEFEINGDKVIVKCYGEGAHGSTPEVGINAITKLLSVLGNIEFDNSEVNEFIQLLNEKIGMELNGESLGVGLEDKISGKLTVNVGALNIDSNKAILGINLRHPVTNSYNDVMPVIKQTFKDSNVKVVERIYSEPLYFEEDHPLIKKLQKVYKDKTGNEAKLISIGGGTYAKEIPNTVAFGPMFPGDEDCIHRVNEYISIDNLVLDAKIYAEALYELAK